MLIPRTGHSLVVIVAAALVGGQVAYAQSVGFPALARQCAPSVNLITLASVVGVESHFDPLAIHVNGKFRLPRQPATQKEAVETAEWLSRHKLNFDAGLGQINSANFTRLGLSIRDIFNPCRNISGAATILEGCYRRAVRGQGRGQMALESALSCYNTGDFSQGFRNGYVRKVAENAILPVPALLPGGLTQLPVESGERSAARAEGNQAGIANRANHSRRSKSDKSGVFAKDAPDIFSDQTGNARAVHWSH